MKYLIVMIVAAAFSGCATNGALVRLQVAATSAKPWPVFNGDVSQAYLLQKKLIASLAPKTSIKGFKAGLTSKAAQTRFNVEAPVSGVLLETMFEQESVSLERFVKPIFELEIGFILSRDVHQPIASIAELSGLIDTIVPVIEVPDLGFSDTDNKLVAPTAPSIVSANVSVRQVITGNHGLSFRTGLVEEIGSSLQIRTQQNQQLVWQSKAELIEQLDTLAWLINHNLAQGYELKAGQLLITGALGVARNLVPGHYIAAVEGLGEVEFEIRQ